MKLWAQYLHQNHWLITPAIVFLLLLLFVFFSKFTYTCMGTIQCDPVNFRRDSARRKNKKIEIQTLWENSDPLGAIVYLKIFLHTPWQRHHHSHAFHLFLLFIKASVHYDDDQHRSSWRRSMGLETRLRLELLVTLVSFFSIFFTIVTLLVHRYIYN